MPREVYTYQQIAKRAGKHPALVRKWRQREPDMFPKAVRSARARPVLFDAKKSREYIGARRQRR